MKVLILDNYDSFVYNLAQYAGEIGDEVVAKRNDEVSIPAVRRLFPDKIIISPGPGTPADPRYFGVCTEVLRKNERSLGDRDIPLGSEFQCLPSGGPQYRFRSIEGLLAFRNQERL